MMPEPASLPLTIALTGATGFVGRTTVVELLRRGHRVRALVRNPAAAKLPGEVETVAGDLSSAASIWDLMTGADAVIHIAGAIMALSEAAFLATNAAPAARLAEAAIAAGAPRFVHVSSLAAREPRLSPYAMSKRAGETAIGRFADRLSIAIVRPPAIYGPGDRATLPLLKSLLSPVAFIPAVPTARFSLMHVADVARVLADAAASRATGTFEIDDGTAGGYAWRDVQALARACEGTPRRLVFLPRALPAAVAQLSQAVAVLRRKASIVTPGKIAELYHPDWVAAPPGWPLADRTTFAKGFPATVAWYRAAGWLPPRRNPDRTPANISGKAAP